MFIVGASSSTAGHAIKVAANGTFIENSGIALEAWGNDLVHTVQNTLAGICVVTLVGAVVYIRLKSP